VNFTLVTLKVRTVCFFKIKKGKPCKKDLPLLKNDITNNLEPQKPVIYSSKHNFGAFLCTPTYCVRHENKKVQNRNDIPHFSFKILAEDL
jgi:hypothetical protein